MSHNPFSLEGKTILITGASSGIGRATAVECSKLGATLIITGRNEERLKETEYQLNGNDYISIPCDFTDTESVNKLILGLNKIDGAVLCAGRNQTVPITFLSRKKIDDIFEINFFSQVELMRLLLKKKLLNTNASIVAVSSIGGNSVFTLGAAAYGSSKAALLSWMKSSAKELAPKYRVNCVCPGQTNTPMNASGEITEEQYESYRSSIPLKRFGEPNDIAYGIIYLLSDASSWVTGTSITIDGGTTL